MSPLLSPAEPRTELSPSCWTLVGANAGGLGFFIWGASSIKYGFIWGASSRIYMNVPSKKHIDTVPSISTAGRWLAGRPKKNVPSSNCDHPRSPEAPRVFPAHEAPPGWAAEKAGRTTLSFPEDRPYGAKPRPVGFQGGYFITEVEGHRVSPRLKSPHKGYRSQSQLLSRPHHARNHKQHALPWWIKTKA